MLLFLFAFNNYFPSDGRTPGRRKTNLRNVNNLKWLEQSKERNSASLQKSLKGQN